MATRGYSISKDDYLKRLRRIEGQVRGLQSMIEEDKYCIDVLTQISSVTKALQGVGMGLLDQHLRHCVMEAARGASPMDGGAVGDEAGGGDQGGATLDEAMVAIERLLRS